MCYNRDACILSMHMDLRSFLNILVFNKLWEKRIVDSSKDGFENGDDWTYLKVSLNMCLKRRARMMTVKKNAIVPYGDRVGGQLVYETSPIA